MHRLICTFVVRIWHKEVFSWCCSFNFISSKSNTFRIDLKFLDRQVWTNSVDHVSHSVSILWMSHSMVIKSFSYQDTPPRHSLLVCILNFDNKTSKIFSKCNHLSGRYLGETHFVHKSRAVTLLKNKEKQNVIG